MEKNRNQSENDNTTEAKSDLTVILSSGPIEATPNTEIISVNVINIDPEQSKDVVIEILNWTTCPPVELGKSVLLCGEQLDPADIGYEEEEEEEIVDFDPTIHPSEMEDYFPVITKPLFFQIPPQMQLTILTDFPQPALLASNPCYEVRIFLKNAGNVLISSYGVNEEFEPQVGNTVLNHQFYSNQPLQLPFPKNPIKKDS